jgi:dTDP-4-dehydrorhamnose 3,5-epimerase-like enzyme
MSQNPKICECPYTKWCHSMRQKLQVQFRKESKTYTKVEQCDFYKKIKKLEISRGYAH